MIPAHIQSTADRLRAQLSAHDRRYYVDDAPIISDAAYDRLRGELEELEARWPGLSSPDSPTQTVGAPVASVKNLRHIAPMRSIQSALDAPTLLGFGRRVRELLGERTPCYRLEPKVDGLAVSIRYERGVLASVATRGDGLSGENVTEAASAIVPALIDTDRSVIEVRGEVYLPLPAFEALNAERRAAGDKPFSHPRHVAAATLRSADPALVADRGLALVCFDAVDAAGEPIGETLSELTDHLADAGLPVILSGGCVNGIDAALAHAHRLARQLSREGTRPHDGIVIKLEYRADQARLGEMPRFPRWAIALKNLPELRDADTRAERPRAEQRERPQRHGLSATPEQLERLIGAGEALEGHARGAADELIDADEGSPKPLYADDIADIEDDIARFNAVRREIEGIQHTLQRRHREAPPVMNIQDLICYLDHGLDVEDINGLEHDALVYLEGQLDHWHQIVDYKLHGWESVADAESSEWDRG